MGLIFIFGVESPNTELLWSEHTSAKPLVVWKPAVELC